MPRDRYPPVSYREPSYEPRPSSDGSLRRSNAFRSSSRPNSSHRDAYHPGVDLDSLGGAAVPELGRYHAPSHGIPYRPQSSHATEERLPRPYPRRIEPDRFDAYHPSRSRSHYSRREVSRSGLGITYGERYPPQNYEDCRREEESHFGRTSPVRYPHLGPDYHPTWNRRDSSLGTQTSGSSRSHCRNWPGEQQTSDGHRWPLHGPHRSGSSSSSARTRSSIASGHAAYDTFEVRPGPRRDPYGRSIRRR